MQVHGGRSLSRVVLLIASLLTLVTMIGCARPQPSRGPADLLIVNAKVYTADGSGTFQEAVAIEGNKIVEVGRTGDLERLRGPKTEVIDAGGRAVLPGFNDNHTHYRGAGLYYNEDSLDIGALHKLPEIQERIREYAKAHPDLPWIIGHGWYPQDFPGSVPTKEILDAAVPDRPAYLRAYCGHSGWANSKALAAAGIVKGTPNPPPDGVIVRDPVTGEPTGYVKESAIQMITRRAIPQPTPEEERRAEQWAMAEAHREGVTTINEIEEPDPPIAGGNPAGFMRWDELRRAGELKLRVYYAMGGDYGWTEQAADQWDAFWREHPDTSLLKTGIAKIYADGACETSSFRLQPTAQGTNGWPNFLPADLNRMVQRLDRSGWQLMIHAIGEGAVHEALDALEHTNQVNPAPARGRRNRIEHGSSVLAEDVPRFAKLGVILSIQGGGPFVPPSPAATTAPPTLPLVLRSPQKSIVDAGGQVILGTDCCYYRRSPMTAVYNFANAPPRPGQPDQRLPVNTLIDAATRGTAYASFWDNQQGTLTPGKLADVVVLATDIFSQPPTKAEDIAVSMTIFDGKVVYRAKLDSPSAQAGRP